MDDGEFIKKFISPNIPRICMVSSSVFGIFTALNAYWAIPSGVAGLASIISESQSAFVNPREINEELIRITKKALELTRVEIVRSKKTDNRIRIIDELLMEEPTPSNFKELVQNTVAYQADYFTRKDCENLVSLFNNHFATQIAKNSTLSQYFALTSNAFTVDKLKIIAKLLEDNTQQLKDIVSFLSLQENKMDSILNDTRHIRTKMDTSIDRVTTGMNELIIIFLQLSSFLFFSLLGSVQYNPVVLIVVAVSYFISNLFVALLTKGGYLYPISIEYIRESHRKCSKSPEIEKVKRFGPNAPKWLLSFAIPLLLPVLCFTMLNQVLDLGTHIGATAIILNLSLILGSLIYILLKMTKQRNIKDMLVDLTHFVVSHESDDEQE